MSDGWADALVGGPDSVVVRRTERDPNFSDESWGTDELALHEVMSGDPLVRRTVARLAWTPAMLWVGFWCAATTVRVTMTDYKDKVWKEDAVEVYLRPPGATSLYEFQLNPIGTARDLCVFDPGDRNQSFDESWCCEGLVTQATIDRAPDRNISGWRALFGFPWKSLGEHSIPPRELRCGLFRMERDPVEFGGLRWLKEKVVDPHDRRLLTTLHFDPSGNKNGEDVLLTERPQRSSL